MNAKQMCRARLSSFVFSIPKTRLLEMRQITISIFARHVSFSSLSLSLFTSLLAIGPALKQTSKWLVHWLCTRTFWGVWTWNFTFKIKREGGGRHNLISLRAIHPVHVDGNRFIVMRVEIENRLIQILSDATLSNWYTFQFGK